MSSSGYFEEFFFAPPASFEDSYVTIGGSEAKHIAVVIRRRPGDTICVLDGRGARYEVDLVECSTERIVGKIIKKEEFSPRTPELWLAAGIIRATRMDLLVEKCTELGVHVIVPICAKRSLSAKGVADSRLARWERISIGAMKQSGQVFLPTLLKPASLEGLLTAVGRDATILLAHPSGKSIHSLAEKELSRAKIVACVGPEGGFTPGEVEFLIKHDAIPVSLGEARLRAETAAMAALDRINFALERLNCALP